MVVAWPAAFRMLVWMTSAGRPRLQGNAVPAFVASEMLLFQELLAPVFIELAA